MVAITEKTTLTELAAIVSEALQRADISATLLGGVVAIAQTRSDRRCPIRSELSSEADAQNTSCGYLRPVRSGHSNCVHVLRRNQMNTGLIILGKVCLLGNEDRRKYAWGMK